MTKSTIRKKSRKIMDMRIFGFGHFFIQNQWISYMNSTKFPENFDLLTNLNLRFLRDPWTDLDVHGCVGKPFLRTLRKTKILIEKLFSKNIFSIFPEAGFWKFRKSWWNFYKISLVLPHKLSKPPQKTSKKFIKRVHIVDLVIST